MESLPYPCYRQLVVVYHGNIHMFGGVSNGSSTKAHYKWNGASWTSLGSLPIAAADDSGEAVVFNDYIYLLCNNYAYKFNDSGWSGATVPTHKITSGSAVVYNGEIHTLGNNGSTDHYRYDGTTSTKDVNLPYYFHNGQAVVYNGEIHIMGTNYTDCKRCHYKFDGTSWTSVSTLPYNFNNGCAASVYNGEIHIMGGLFGPTCHYKFNGTSWTSVSTLPYKYRSHRSVVFNNSLMIMGGVESLSQHAQYITPERIFSPQTVIMQRGHHHNGTYITVLADLSPRITGECNRFTTGFDDVFYFADTAFEWNAPMYYGDGTR